MTTTNTTPGLARLRRHPKAAAVRSATLAAQRKGRKAPTKLAVLDPQRTFAGQMGRCWALVKAAPSVAANMVAGQRDRSTGAAHPLGEWPSETHSGRF